MKKTFALLTLAAAFPLAGCGGLLPEDASSEEEDEVYQAQLDDYNRQTEHMDRMLSEQEAQLERARQQGDRFDQILTKWEEQNQRMDAILDAREKQVGVQP